MLPPRADRPAELLDADALSDGQREALAVLEDDGDALVVAAPRSGATSLIVTAAARAVGADDILVLAPTRARSAAIRTALMAAQVAADPTPPVPPLPACATPTAAAFAVVADRSARVGRGDPTLVTGADQDALLEEILRDPALDWPTSLQGAVHELPGFRTEVRDVIARAAERGLGPEDLAELGRRAHRPVWSTTAGVFEAYRDVLALQAATAVDAGPRLDGAGLVDAAVQEIEAGRAPSPDVLLVDDLHDFTRAGVRLIQAHLRAGARALITTSADQATETFRGGMPEAAGLLLESAPRPLHPVTLTEAFDQDGAITVFTDRIRSRLPLHGAPAATRRPRAALPAPEPDEPTEPLPPCAVAAVTAPDADDEARRIATVIRALRGEDGVSLDDMLLICRSGGAADDLAASLIRRGVPVRTDRRATALRDEHAVQSLSAVIRTALNPSALTPDAAAALLRGAFGDADDLQLTTLRRLLLAAADTEDAHSDQLLVRSLTEPGLAVRDEVLAAQPKRRRAWARGALAPLLRVRTMIDAVRDLDSRRILDVLWAAWQASGRAGVWQRAALEDGDEGARMRAAVMNRRLDAMTALFTAGDRYQERQADADIAVFLAHIDDQEVPEDSLSARSALPGRLHITTPAGAADHSADTVIIAGLQEGAWPNVRIRSSVLGAADLALIADRPDLEHADLDLIRSIQRESVLMDELRMMVSAASRARRRLLLTAVDSDSSAPSVLLRLAQEVTAQHGGAAWTQPILTGEDPGPYPDPRRLIASLQRRIATADDDDERDRRLRQLERLITAGIPGADPHTWYHQAPSTRRPVIDDDDRLRLSPSALETAAACIRAHLLEAAADPGTAGPAQLIGTALHALAEAHPTAGPDELVRRLPDHLPRPAADAPWREHADYERAVTMADKLGQYQLAHPDVDAVEQRFDITLGRVDLVGTIDRIEREDGQLRVVDYKTGTAAKSADAAMQDLQLAAYQTALADQPGSAPVAGASLVHIGTATKSAAIRHQAPLRDHGDPDWFRTLVADIDAAVRTLPQMLHRNDHCRLCAVRSSCPLQDDGQQLR